MTNKSVVRPRIFVQIPSYRDSQTQWTVKDLFDKAMYPERVFVGICWQFDKENDADCFVEPSPRPENVRVIEFKHTESHGLGWARQQAQTLSRNEEYTLQIDAHMRFEKNWDALLIDMLEMCPGEKNILSHYPPSFVLPDQYISGSVPYMYPARFNEAGITIEKSFSFGNDAAPSRPILNYFVAGGMIFAPSELFSEVPPDPHIYFWGEQVGTAVRAWTRGWNIYSPHRNVIYHIYHESGGRPLNWNDNPEWIEKSNKTSSRMQYLLGIADSVPEEYASDMHLLELGKNRALVEYEQLAGLRFRDKQILPHTVEYCIERLRYAGTKLNAITEDWYQSLFIIDIILYEQDEDKVASCVERFFHNSTVKRHHFSVHIHYAKRCLDRRNVELAEDYAMKAMRSEPSKPNGYAMVGRILMREGRYDEAYPLLFTANQLCTNVRFSSVFHGEPHPLTLLALVCCKKSMPEDACRYAVEAMAVDHRNKSYLQAIIDDPNNPVGKEFWLFPDKMTNFKHYQALNDISQDWKDWARSNVLNGVSRNSVRLKIETVGFRSELVRDFLDSLYMDNDTSV